MNSDEFRRLTEDLREMLRDELKTAFSEEIKETRARLRVIERELFGVPRATAISMARSNEDE